MHRRLFVSKGLRVEVAMATNAIGYPTFGVDTARVGG
jgi:hypothetical protein